MKHKPRIAVIGLKGLPAFGGAAAVGENIINQLKDEYEFTVYSTSSHTTQKTGLYNGYEQIVFRKLPFKRLNTLYYYIISAFHSVFVGKYDLIHLHHRDAAFILTILKLKYPVIITTHSSFYVTEKWKKYSWFFELNERKFVRMADIITCVSKEEQRKYKLNIGLETIHIPNGINLFDNKYNLSNFDKYKPYLFFGAGRIIPSKGLHTLLKALNLLKYKGYLIVAGDIDQINNYKKQILKLSENLNVEYIGLIKNKNMLLSIIKNAQLFIFPSSLESMSMMLLEGASVSTPIICSDITENKDIFNEDEVLYFKTDNYIDLSNKIAYALQNDIEMKRRAKKAYKKLIDEYNWLNISQKYSFLYKTLLKYD